MPPASELNEPISTSRGNGGLPEISARLPGRMTPKELEDWRASVKHIQDCHYDAAASLSWQHYATGIPLVILSAVSASSLVTDADILAMFGSYAKLVASGLALLVTVLAAIQAFLGFEKRSGLHYKAGAQYGALKREIDLYKENHDGKWLSDVAEKWDALTTGSPIIPLRIWRRNSKPSPHRDQLAELSAQAASRAA